MHTHTYTHAHTHTTAMIQTPNGGAILMTRNYTEYKNSYTCTMSHMLRSACNQYFCSHNF